MAVHPLTTPATWQLSAGGGLAESPRRMAMALWLFSALAVLVWASALIAEATIWDIDAVVVMLALVLPVVWLAAAWRTWCCWREAVTPLTLEWTGLPPTASRRVPDPASVGFRVTQWQAPVQVQMMLDLQTWILLRVQSCQLGESGESARASWVWLDTRGRPEGDIAALHQLRTLLVLPQRMRTLAADKAAGLTVRNNVAAIPMASWAIKFNSGSKLPRPVTPRRTVRRPAHAASKADSLFPPTHVMDGWTSSDTAACDHEVRS